MKKRNQQLISSLKYINSWKLDIIKLSITKISMEIKDSRNWIVITHFIFNNFKSYVEKQFVEFFHIVIHISLLLSDVVVSSFNLWNNYFHQLLNLMNLRNQMLLIHYLYSNFE